jgi:dipeptidase E
MKNILDLHKRTDIEFEVADDLLKYQSEDLRLFDAIYIGGGNTWSLMQEIKGSGFFNILIKYIEEGGQIYGGSAGAIILGKRIDTHDDENKIELDDMFGLGLLNNYSVTCHFKDENGDRFRKWAMNNNFPIVCLPEETGLVIENGVALCVGTKPCTVYSADGTERNVNSGESFSI